jgi:uncharacterized delta-60 repeat protein
MAGKITRYGQIVSDGLVWNLNASDRTSYPRFGTRWNDKTDFQTPAILTNGPTFADSGSYQYIRTDGANDFIQPTVTGTTKFPGFKWGLHWDLDWTFETWLNPTRYGGVTYAYLYAQYNGSAVPTYPSCHTIGLSNLTTTPSIYFNPSAEDLSVTNLNTTFLRTNTGSMQHITVTMRDGTEMRTYRNGILISSGTYDFKNTGFGRVNAVETIKIDNNNNIWVGGTFAKYNNQYVTYGLVKLNSDGTIVSNWNTGSTAINPNSNVGLTGFNHKVMDIEFSGSSANIYGQFNQYKNNTQYCGVRVDATGSRTTFVAPLFNYGIRGRTNSAGQVYVGISNSTFYGGLSTRFLRTNNSMATVDLTFKSGSSFNSSVYVIKLDANEKPLVGGEFSLYSGSSARYIARVNTDGTLDTTFTTGTGFNAYVSTIVTASDGKIYAAGNFTTYSGSTANRVIRINSNGTYDRTFNTGTGFNNVVNYIDTDLSGKLLVAGTFTTYSGSAVNRIARINTDGTLDTTFNTGTGFDLPTKAVAIDQEGNIYVGGQFFKYNGTPANGIICLNDDGTVNTSFNYGTGFSRANDRPPQYAASIAGSVIGFVEGNWGEIRLYNRSLSAAEVLRNYSGSKGKYGL